MSESIFGGLGWEGVAGAIIDKVHMTPEDYVNEELVAQLKRFFIPKPQPDSSSIPECTCQPHVFGDDPICPKHKHIYSQARDSSSISTEQTFEEWWEERIKEDHYCDFKGFAECAWNAAKGQR